ncbi:MAG: dodecin [Pseudomonadota bacterium]|uniref:Dodecin domain-containing protein n=1 Tax=Vreelandella salicampi TaxID=1449798 RepID=A0A7Z0LJP7_9GAMM|nr:dodecin [Halomonas salicampi]NYS60155.1 dodecin domain-containing protein [Halomonas salicampi]
MTHHTYKHIELTGSSEKSMEDAVQNAIGKAAESVKNMRWFEMVDTRGHIEDGRVAHWQVTVKVGFTLE